MYFRIRDLVEISEILPLICFLVDDSLMEFQSNSWKTKIIFWGPQCNMWLAGKMAVRFDRTTTDLFISCLPPSFPLHSGFLGATAPHSLTNSAAPNAVLNSLNSSMSPLQTPSPSTPTPSPSLWPSSLTSTQGWYINQCLFSKVSLNISVFFLSAVLF